MLRWLALLAYPLVLAVLALFAAGGARVTPAAYVLIAAAVAVQAWAERAVWKGRRR